MGAALAPRALRSPCTSADFAWPSEFIRKRGGPKILLGSLVGKGADCAQDARELAQRAQLVRERDGVRQVDT